MTGRRRGSLRIGWRLLVVAAIGVVACLANAIATASPVRPFTGPVAAWPIVGPFGVDGSGAPMPAGRVQDIAADPFVAHRYLALSDGALWQTTNNAASWSKLTGLDRFGQWNFEHGTIAFDPVQQGVVLISSPFDRRSATQIGIYRSTDGGQLWQSAISFQPDCGQGVVGHPTTVSFSGHQAVAAGTCAVGLSPDDGIHWSWTAPDTGGGFDGTTFDSAGTPFACGNDGIFSFDGTSWTKVVDFTDSSVWSLGTPKVVDGYSTCRITAAPSQPNHVFVAARWNAMVFTTPTGQLSDVAEAYRNTSGHWTGVDLFGGGHQNNRDVFVQTRPSTAGRFDLYWGTTDNVEFQTCTPGMAADCTPGTTHNENLPDAPWGTLGIGPNVTDLHADINKLLFDSSRPWCLRLVANDGGVQRPNSGNCNGVLTGAWSYADRGMFAAEFTDMALTSIEGLSRPAVDVYGASHDNDAFVLMNATSGWGNVAEKGDGYPVAATPVVASNALSTVTTVYGSDGTNYLGGRALSGLQIEPPAPPAQPNTLFSPPCSGLVSVHQTDLTADGKFAMACVAANLQSSSIYTSGSGGTLWDQVPRSSVTSRSGDLSGVSIYAVNEGEAGTHYFVRIGGALWRVTTTESPTRLLTSWDIGPIATTANGDHLLTFACPPAPETCAANGVVRLWTASTNTWTDLDSATSLLTSDVFGNTYPLDNDAARLATDGEAQVLAIDPTNSARMAIGTRDVGVIVSNDGGTSWQRLPFAIRNVTGLQFDHFHRLYVSTYGLGISGGQIPLVPRLSVTVSASHVHLSKAGNLRVSWSAHLVDQAGNPLAGVPLRFTLRDSTGAETEVGIVSTDAAGNAASTRIVPDASYTLLARWEPANGATLVTSQAVNH